MGNDTHTASDTPWYLVRVAPTLESFRSVRYSVCVLYLVLHLVSLVCVRTALS